MLATLLSIILVVGMSPLGKAPGVAQAKQPYADGGYTGNEAIVAAPMGDTEAATQADRDIAPANYGLTNTDPKPKTMELALGEGEFDEYLYYKTSVDAKGVIEHPTKVGSIAGYWVGVGVPYFDKTKASRAKDATKRTEDYKFDYGYGTFDDQVTHQASPVDSDNTVNANGLNGDGGTALFSTVYKGRKAYTDETYATGYSKDEFTSTADLMAQGLWVAVYAKKGSSYTDLVAVYDVDTSGVVLAYPVMDATSAGNGTATVEASDSAKTLSTSSGVTNHYVGETVTVTTAPSAGYKASGVTYIYDSVTYDAEPQGGNAFTFEMPAGEITAVAATFVRSNPTAPTTKTDSHVASIEWNSTPYYFTTLKAAVDEAKALDIDTVSLVKDATVTMTASTDAVALDGVTLDLAGKKLTLASNADTTAALSNTTGKAAIVDTGDPEDASKKGSISVGYATAISAGADLDVTGVAFEGAVAPLLNASAGTVTSTGSTFAITGEGTTGGTVATGVISLAGTAKLAMNGGKVTGKAKTGSLSGIAAAAGTEVTLDADAEGAYPEVSAPDNALYATGASAKLDVRGGKYTATAANSQALTLASAAEAAISGGEFEGESFAVTAGATEKLAIEDGEFTYSAATTAASQTTPAPVATDGVLNLTTASDKATSLAKVEGGTFGDPDEATVTNVFPGAADTNVKAILANVSGGTFNSHEADTADTPAYPAGLYAENCAAGFEPAFASGAYTAVKTLGNGGAAITKSDEQYTYDGEAKKPAVVVKWNGGDALEAGKDYTVQYSEDAGTTWKDDVKAAGDVQVKVTAAAGSEFKSGSSATATLALIDKINLADEKVDVRFRDKGSADGTAYVKKYTGDTTHPEFYSPDFAVYYDGKLITSKVGTTAGSAQSLDSGMTYEFDTANASKPKDGAKLTLVVTGATNPYFAYDTDSSVNNSRDFAFDIAGIAGNDLTNGGYVFSIKSTNADANYTKAGTDKLEFTYAGQSAAGTYNINWVPTAVDVTTAGGVALTNSTHYTWAVYSDADCTQDVTSDGVKAVGTYYLKVSGNNSNDYFGSKVFPITVKKLDLSGSSVKAPEFSINYSVASTPAGISGQVDTRGVKYTIGNKEYTLKEGVDYTVKDPSYSALVSGAAYTVTGMGDCEGENSTGKVTVNPADIDKVEADTHGAALKYNGEAQAPKPKFTVGAANPALVEGTDYNVDYYQVTSSGTVKLGSAPTAAGSYKAVYTGIGNYSTPAVDPAVTDDPAEKKINFTITKVDLNEAGSKLAAKQTAAPAVDGDDTTIADKVELTLTYTDTWGEKVDLPLSAGTDVTLAPPTASAATTDYYVSGSGLNIAAGQYTGNFIFKRDKALLSDKVSAATVGAPEAMTYNGTNQAAKFDVKYTSPKDKQVELEAGTDYDVYYLAGEYNSDGGWTFAGADDADSYNSTAPKAAGKYRAVLKGKGDYAGVVKDDEGEVTDNGYVFTDEFEVAQLDIEPLTLADASFVGALKYNGTEQAPALSAPVSATLEDGTATVALAVAELEVSPVTDVKAQNAVTLSAKASDKDADTPFYNNIKGANAKKHSFTFNAINLAADSSSLKVQFKNEVTGAWQDAYTGLANKVPATQLVFMDAGGAHEIDGGNYEITVEKADGSVANPTVTVKAKEGNLNVVDISVGKVGFNGNASGQYKISSQTLDGLALTLSEASPVNFKNDNYSITTSIAASASAKLVQGTHYDVQVFKDGELVSTATTATAIALKAVGEYTLYAVGKGDYAGTSAAATFEIKPLSLSAEGMTFAFDGVDFDSAEGVHVDYVEGGKADLESRYLSVKSADPEMTLAYGTDYTAECSGSSAAGTATVTFTGKGDFAGSSATKTYTVDPLEFSAAAGYTVVFDDEGMDAGYMAYTGSEVKPAYTIYDKRGNEFAGTATLAEKYYNNENVAYATGNLDPQKNAFVVVEASGNYTGSINEAFGISPVDLSEAEGVEISAAPLNYTGAAVEPQVTITFNGKKLAQGTDFTVTPDADFSVGTHTAAINLPVQRNFTASKTLTADYEILKTAQTITADPASVSFTEGGSAKFTVNNAVGPLDFKVSGVAQATRDGNTFTVTATGAGEGSVVVTAGETDSYAASNTLTVPVTVAAKPAPAPEPTPVVKSANSYKVTKAKTATVKYKKLKKKAQTLAISKVLTEVKGQGTMTYTVTKVKKGKKTVKKANFKINKTSGKITVKKKLAKGTYKVTLTAKAAGDDTHEASAKVTKTVTVKVK